MPWRRFGILACIFHCGYCLYICTLSPVTKATKDSFIAELVGLNKQHLVITSIEPDLDSIFAEVDAGSLDKVLVDQYVKVTPVVTLRCN